MKKYILIGGIFWLAKKWLMRSGRLLRKNGLKYGDKVIKEFTDKWGRDKKITGVLIKKDGIPKVFLDKSISGKNLVSWDESFQKKN